MAKYKTNVGSELLPGLLNLNGQDVLALMEMVVQGCFHPQGIGHH